MMLVQVLDMSVGGSHEWRSVASMSTRRSSVGVGVLQVGRAASSPGHLVYSSHRFIT